MQLTMGITDDPQVAADKARAVLALEALDEAVKAAVRLVTPKELCYRLGITQQYLSEAVDRKNRKGFRLEWLPTLILMAPIEAVVPILKALAELRSFKVERVKQLTPEEELKATREALSRLAPGVLALVDKEIGK